MNVVLAGAVALPKTLPVEAEDPALGVNQPARLVLVAAGLLPVPHGGAAAFLDVRVLR